MSIFIYKVVFQITYFSELHSLVIFIILGVGADDVFVLTDSWRMTPQMIIGGGQMQYFAYHCQHCIS
ncbi:hypothetical protein B484DRAFT_412332 [Ochromonadaceae sp. CCMP2298]|nr:hypothetical protein B484DRAFT_412332 [Ochromonadaceae sp. CCMP2298]